MMTTNYLVVKQAQLDDVPLEFYEVNPLQQDINDYAAHPDNSNLLPVLIRQLLLWFVIIAIYVYVRRTIYTESMFTYLIFTVVLYFVILGHDAFNDLGLWLGVVL